MKLNGSLFVVAVATLTVVATVDRVSTAPERIRVRADSARAQCIAAGNEWVRQGRDELCRAPASASKGG